MGLFGKKKEETNSLTSWLTKADEAYSLAFQTKSIAPLEPYVDQTCARSLIGKLRANEKAYSGLDRYKHVSWTKAASASTGITYKKTVKYDHVKLSHGVIAPVGEDHVELWTLSTCTPQKITEIRRLGI